MSIKKRTVANGYFFTERNRKKPIQIQAIDNRYKHRHGERF